ncbi:MAG: hypothetical protein Aurels2KO_01430 [Aureliella sp.]
MRLGRVKGIDVNIHWSFWMLVLFYLISTTIASGAAEGVLTFLFINAVFVCILLHEFGHALAAARYGIKTADITIFAFGGLARLTKATMVPIQELVIAVAGPLVNVAIALGLGALMVVGLLPTAFVGEATAEGTPLTFWDMLLAANLFLVLFNMLPAFPMDGGRVLRSLLSMRVGQMRATEIAARAGRWMALLFVVAGFWYSNFSLMLIAGFIFLAGTAELIQTRMRHSAEQMAGQAPGGFPGGGAFPQGFPGAFQASWSYSQSGPAPSSSSQPGWQADGNLGSDPDVIDADDVRQIR